MTKRTIRCPICHTRLVMGIIYDDVSQQYRIAWFCNCSPDDIDTPITFRYIDNEDKELEYRGVKKHRQRLTAEDLYELGIDPGLLHEDEDF